MKKLLLFFFLLYLFNCNISEEKKTIITQPKLEVEVVKIPIINLTQANKLAQLPINWFQNEYPNKLNQTIGSDSDLQSPILLHPAFYGCFDWHLYLIFGQ